MEEEKSRIYNPELDNPKILNPLISYFLENKDKYFMAFRFGRIAFYYKRALFDLVPESKENWYLYPRSISEVKKESAGYERLTKLNQDYQKKMQELGFSLTKIKLEENEDYTPVFSICQKFLDGYCLNQDEKVIQNEIACRYQSLNGDLLCVDEEYNQSFINEEAKKQSTIHGRYDFIFLKKEVNQDKYYPVFVELKSNRGACLDFNTGIINHYCDMQNFFKAYDNDPDNVQKILKESIKFAVERKFHFGLLPEDISAKIDFTKHEFWILFNMPRKVSKFMPQTEKELFNLIDEEIKKAKSGKEEITLRINDQEIKKKDLFWQDELVKNLKKEILNCAYYGDFFPIKD